MELTNEQWEKIQDLIPDPVKRADGRGRPARDMRQVLEGVLWILHTGAPWKDLPARFPPCCCHRRFQQRQQQGVMRRVVEALTRDLMARGGVDLSECFIDGSFCMAKKGALLLAKLNAVKAPSSWQSLNAAGLVLSVSIASASPHEVGLVEQVLAERFLEPMPQRLVGDRAYDSDPLDEKLRQRGGS